MPDKLGNLESLKKRKKKKKKFESFSTDVPIVDEVLLRAVYTLFYLQFFDSTIFATDVFINSLLFSFCPFLQTKTKNQVFSKLVVW